MSPKSKTALSLLAVATILVALPSDARRTPARSSTVWTDIEALERDVNRTDNRDTISEREAAGLRSQIADLKADFHRMNANGLTPAETGHLESRIHQLRGRLKNERHDRDHHRG